MPLAALLMATAAPIQAALTVRLSADNGATWTTVTDGGVGDASGAPGLVTFIGAVGSWSVNVTTGTSKPTTGTADAPYLDINTINFSSTAAGKLTIQLSDTDFAPAGQNFLAAIGGTTDGAVTFRTWADAGNALFAMTTPLTSQGPFTGGAFNGDQNTPVGSGGAPYSLTLEGTITHTTARASSGFDALLTGSSCECVIRCPNNQTVQCLTDVPVRPTTLTEFLAQGGAVSGNCATNYFSQDGPLVGGPCGGTITRTHSIVNLCGTTNSCVQTITVSDTIRPELPALPLGGDLGCNPKLPGCVAGLKATDNCDGQVDVICTPGAVQNVGTCGKSQSFVYEATDLCGNKASATVTYAWSDDAGPAVTGPLSHKIACEGEPVQFCITVVSPCGATYAWFKDGVLIPGAANACYSIPSVKAADAGEYCVVVTGPCNAVTNCARLELRAALGDRVWEDANANGCQDPGELGVPNVPVILWDCSGQSLATNQTDADGLYLFTCLPPGGYQIQVLPPAGYSFTVRDACADDTDSDANPATGITTCTNLHSGETNLTVDIGLFRLASIGNYVWVDVNRNGIQDDGDTGLAQVKVELLDCLGTVRATTFTDASGFYSFAGLTPGNYNIRISPPAGYVVTVRNAPGSTSENDSDAAADGVMVCTALVAGENDRSWDAGLFQPPPECVPAVLSLVAPTTTNPEDGPDGNIRTFSVGNVSVKASAFSRTKLSGTWAAAFLGRYSTGLGVTDASEGDGSDGRHTTDNLGRENYILFEFSEPVIVRRAYLGYVVDDSDLSVWIGTFADPFNNHLTLSDSVLASFSFSEVNLTSSSSPRWASLNAGEVVGNALVMAAKTGETSPNDQFKIAWLDICAPPGNFAALGDYVWEDSNRNGVQDEPATAGINGVTVKLLDCAGNVLGTTTTANDTGGNPGYYRFSDLVAGCYRVQFMPPSGYLFTSANAAGSPQSDSDADPATGTTGELNLAAGTTDLSWDAGLYREECVPSIFTFSGSSPQYGTPGKVRTFSVDGVSVKVSAFSRTKASGTWAAVYLGLYSAGLGVTDASEGDGSDYRHAVDNIGRENYVLFEFSEPVVVRRAYLGWVRQDSDLTAWIGTFADPFNNHLVLSDSVLGSFTLSEVNLTASSSPRWAELNAGQVAGNALVIAAQTGETSPNDQFKIQKLDICKPAGSASGGQPDGSGGSLPSPWQTQDIGPVQRTGSAAYTAGVFSVSGSGDRTTDDEDELRFVYQQAEGDCSIVARVLSVEDTDDEAQAGVMIRETLNANSRHVAVFVTRDEGLQFRARTSTGNEAVNLKQASDLKAPYWVKLVRVGDLFTGYRSADGANWTVMGSATVPMGASVYLGLGVTSHDDDDLCTATVGEVIATP